MRKLAFRPPLVALMESSEAWLNLIPFRVAQYKADHKMPLLYSFGLFMHFVYSQLSISHGIEKKISAVVDGESENKQDINH